MLENIPSYFFAVIMLGSVLLGLLGLAWALVEIICGIFPGLIPTRQTAHVVTRPRTQPAQPRVMPRQQPQKITPEHLVANPREPKPPRQVDPLTQTLFYKREAPLAAVISSLPRLSLLDIQARTGHAFVLLARPSGNFLIGFRHGQPVVSTFASRAIHFADLRMAATYGKFFQSLTDSANHVWVCQFEAAPQVPILAFDKPRGVSKAMRAAK